MSGNTVAGVKDPYADTNPKDLQGIKKPPLHLVPPTGILHEAMAFLEGGIKYGPYNWREKAVIASIYVSACMRHIDAWWDGEEYNENMVHHLGNARACLNIILDAAATGNLKDDRPMNGPTSRLLVDLSERVVKMRDKLLTEQQAADIGG